MSEDQARIDLHVHTVCSDGGFTPRQAVELAASKGLKAIAIADHDSLEGLPEANKAADQAGITLVPGVELSSSLDGKDVHVVGLFVDSTDEVLKSFLEDFRNLRKERAREIVKRVNKFDVNLDFEEVEKAAKGGTMGRPHVADALLNIGAVSTHKEAFVRFLGFDGPAYVPKTPYNPEKAIELIHQAGGLAILAHPGITFRFSEEQMHDVMSMGMDGMEVRHPRHGKDMDAKLEGMALARGYLRSGGSDCHGGFREELFLGNYTVPAKYLDELRNSLKI